MPSSPNWWGAALVVLAASLSASSLLASISNASATFAGPDQIVAGLRLAWAWEQGVHRPWWMQLLVGEAWFLPRYSPSVVAYAIAALGWLGLSPATALDVLGASAVLVGALGVHLLARRFLPPGPAAIAGVAYALSPYVLMSLYVQGDYSLLWLTALVPYWLWGWADLSARGSRWGFLALAFATAGLAAGGGTALVLLAPLLALYAGWRSFREGRSHRPALLLALAGGLLASAVAWLPEWTELVGEVGGVARRLGPAGVPALSVGDLLAWPRAVDRRALGDLLPLGLGGHLVVPALAALAHLRRQTTRPRGHVVFMLATAIGYSLLTLPIAAPIWAAFPPVLLPDPYLLLGPAAMAVALLVGAGLEAWSTRHAGTGRLAFAITLTAIALGAGPYLFPRTPYPVGGTAPLPEALLVPAGLPERSRAVWPLQELDQPAGAPADSRMRLIAAGPDWLRVFVDSSTEASTLLPLRYSATVVAAIDGRAQPVRRDQETGLTEVELPAGIDREIELRLTRSRTGRWGTWLSLVGGGLLPAGLALAGRGRTLRVRGAAAGATALDLRWPVLVLLIAAVAQVAYIAPRTTWFRKLSPPGAVSGVQHPRGDVLGGEVALLGYDLVRNLPPQGESLGLTLYWQPLGDLRADYRAFVHLVAPADGRVLWREEVSSPGGLPTSAWDASLYVKDRHGPVLPGDLPAARYQLRVGLYDRVSGQALRTAAGETSIYLQDIQVLYHFPLDVKRFPGRDWYRFGEHATLLGFDLTQGTLSSGAAASLTLFWRTEEAVPQRLKRFVHLVDADGSIVAQWESWPVDGTYPTDLWLPQHTIADELQITVPASAAPGDYRLVVGLRDPITLVRPNVTRRGRDDLAERTVTLPGAVRVTE